MNYNVQHIGLLFGVLFTAGGLISLVVAAKVNFEKADQHWFWGYWTRPYRTLDASGVGGGRKRFFTQIGWVFTVLGIAMLIGQLLGRRAV